MNKRIETLDWLRGLMAASIMFYHLTSWLIAPLDASSLLGRLGVYAVSIFFVLSGLSMAIVYSKYIKDIKTSTNFIIRRVFRIWPLLWVCIALVVIPAWLRGNSHSLGSIVLNLTTAFGFIDPGGYINTGAWSIGNEMVYYALTPIILYLYNKRKIFGDVIAFMSFVVLGTFALFFLNMEDTLANQWSIYINPFNNLFLYVVGIAIYYNLGSIQFDHRIASGLAVISFLFLAFYPSKGDTITIVAGVERFIYVFFCVLLVIAFYKIDHNVIKIKPLKSLLEHLGVATYGIYLLHPIINSAVEMIFGRFYIVNIYLQFSLVVVTTVVIAILSFNMFEKRMIDFGKKITSSRIAQ